MCATSGFGKVAGGGADELKVARQDVCAGGVSGMFRWAGGGNEPVKASRTEGLAVVRPAVRRTCAAVMRRREKKSS